MSAYFKKLSKCGVAVGTYTNESHPSDTAWWALAQGMTRTNLHITIIVRACICCGCEDPFMYKDRTKPWQKPLDCKNCVWHHPRLAFVLETPCCVARKANHYKFTFQSVQTANGTRCSWACFCRTRGKFALTFKMQWRYMRKSLEAKGTEPGVYVAI